MATPYLREALRFIGVSDVRFALTRLRGLAGFREAHSL